MNTAHHLLQIFLPHHQATPLVDLLLAQENTPFFTVMEVFGHGQPEEQLSAAEQVEGAQRKIRIDIELRAEAVKPLLRNIRDALPTANIFYRILPIIEHSPLARARL